MKTADIHLEALQKELEISRSEADILLTNIRRRIEAEYKVGREEPMSMTIVRDQNRAAVYMYRYWGDVGALSLRVQLVRRTSWRLQAILVEAVS